MLHPESAQKRYWEILVFIFTVLASVIIPYRFVLPAPAGPGILLIEGIWSVVFILNILITLRSAVFHNGILINDPKTIYRKYLSKGFALDFISALPFDLFFDLLESSGMTNSLGPYTQFILILRFLRLLRLIPSIRLTHQWQHSHLFNPSLVHMLFLFFWILMIAHWGACGWIYFSGLGPVQDHYTKYIRALYWSITTLTTIGYGDIVPVTNTQIIYAMLVAISGAGLYGYVIGNIASLLANMNIAKTQHLEKMKTINTFMRYKDFPTELQQKIRKYYTYLWESRRDYDEVSLTKDMPSSLKREVSLFLKREVIEKVPIFRGTEDGFIKEIVMHLKPVVYTPGDFIFHAGEIGHDMYFISKGVVEIVSGDGSNVYATLTDGDFFGEIALVTNQPRTASVRAADYCDLYTLDKKTLERVLEHFPDIAGHIHAMAKERASSTAEQKMQMPEK